MNGIERHYFPGNNTPGGFFSYYHYVMNQKEAQKIWCLKGGPGTGKSTFMKKIGANLLSKGLDVDFLHCSSDSNSLDGIVLRERGVAIFDATPPHSIDPINPGAVDSIIDLGRFWSEEGIRKNRAEIIKIRETISATFKKAYNYLGAAEKMYDNLQLIYGGMISRNIAREIAQEVIADAAGNVKSSSKEGVTRRFFATAITPQGVKNNLPNIIGSCNKIYILKTMPGWNDVLILNYIYENLISRGYDVETFYCSMKPGEKIEHIIVPELSLAVISSNSYHEFPEETSETQDREVLKIEFNRPGCKYFIGGIDRKTHDVTKVLREKSFSFDDKLEIDCKGQMKLMIDSAVSCLVEAKRLHDTLEEFYIPNMDFESLEKHRMTIEDQILKL